MVGRKLILFQKLFINYSLKPLLKIPSKLNLVLHKLQKLPRSSLLEPTSNRKFPLIAHQKSDRSGHNSHNMRVKIHLQDLYS